MKYEYLPSEGWKKVYKSISTYYGATGECITAGIICQQYSTDRDVIEIVNKVLQTNIPNQEILLTQFELFIKQSEFTIIYDSLYELWSQGQKQEALQLLQDKGAELGQLVIKSKTFDRVFGQFNERTESRALNRSLGFSRTTMPTGIDELDLHLGGGLEKGDTMLITARSGVGKSTCLRWLGISCARRGGKVAHFQLEGSKDECMTYYDVLWTGLNRTILRYEEISPELAEKLRGVISNIDGEIFVESYEQFGSASINDMRNTLDSLQKMGHAIDLIIIDYLEKAQPSNPDDPGKRFKGAGFSEKGEMLRRAKLAEQCKNIALEYNSRVATATQASTISPEQYNNPNFVMTRYHISQFKAVVDPFSVHITLNQTDDELENDYMRLYIDKDRHNKPGKTIHIYQRREIGRF
ncbi:MAG: hypothetical protein JHC54_08920, partial [Acinetobacter sp.]|nr:hypothetical protein [Acinetobacter sp.]